METTTTEDFDSEPLMDHFSLNSKKYRLDNERIFAKSMVFLIFTAFGGLAGFALEDDKGYHVSLKRVIDGDLKDLIEQKKNKQEAESDNAMLSQPNSPALQTLGAIEKPQSEDKWSEGEEIKLKDLQKQDNELESRIVHLNQYEQGAFLTATVSLLLAGWLGWGYLTGSAKLAKEIVNKEEKRRGRNH